MRKEEMAKRAFSIPVELNRPCAFHVLLACTSDPTLNPGPESCRYGAGIWSG